MKVLIIGEEIRYRELHARLAPLSDLEIEFSDGDEEEDFGDYDVIFDLNLMMTLATFLSMRA
jgi:hypothetical protein